MAPPHHHQQHQQSPLVAPRPSTPPNRYSTSSHDAAHQQQQQHMNTGSSSLFSNQQQPVATTAMGWGAAAASSTSASSSTNLFSAPQSPQHAVQWGHQPALHPASVHWGSNTSFGGSSYASTSALPDASSAAAGGGALLGQPIPDKARKSEVKRKRERNDDEDEEMGYSATRSSPTEDFDGRLSPARLIAGSRGAGNLVPKRIRAGLGSASVDHRGANDDADGSSGGLMSPSRHRQISSGSRDGSTTSMAGAKLGGDIDLGKMLGEFRLVWRPLVRAGNTDRPFTCLFAASLDKPHLLSLLLSLLQTNTSLLPLLPALLPLPTLSTITASLDTHEGAIRSALPFGSGSIRPEYAWSRLRGPVAELGSAVQGWMDFYRIKQEQQQDPNTTSEDGTHPTTMFSLLHTITVRAVKIQRDLLPPVPSNSFPTANTRSGASANADQGSNNNAPSALLLRSLPSSTTSPASPNSLLTMLLPLLLEAWSALLARISRDVNGQGKMFGREVVIGWIRGLEDLVATCRHQEDERQQRKANDEDERTRVMEAIAATLEVVSDGLKREIGWVVGLH